MDVNDLRNLREYRITIPETAEVQRRSGVERREKWESGSTVTDTIHNINMIRRQSQLNRNEGRGLDYIEQAVIRMDN